MGRRKLITQRELNAILNSKRPYVGFFVLSAVFTIMSIILFNIEYMEILGGMLALFATLFFLCAICFLVSSIQAIEHSNAKPNEPTKTYSISSTIIQKPSYDFFASDAEINTEYLKKLLYAQSILPSTHIKPYDGYEESRVVKLEFNERLHSAKVAFSQTKYYRTIERYTQQNYQRTPIYSYLKSKTKEYTKTFSLKNEALESMHSKFNSSEDHLYMDVITRLNNTEMVPYHYFLKSLGGQFELKEKFTNQAIRKLEEETKSENSKILFKIKSFTDKTENLNIALENSNAKLSKLKLKLEKKGSISQKKMAKIELLTSDVNNINDEIITIQAQISTENQKLNILNNSLKAKINELKDDVSNARKKYFSLLKQYQSLKTCNECQNEFFPIKNLLSMSYQKIKGCYVIKNTEKNKYYVGQSKDVMGRLKQHFKGSEPKNIIFAEDYFNSELSDKSKLFEVMILELPQDQELDEFETSLIEQYEAFTKGYNGTRGNS